ncbi:hypothetical protein EVAR_49680_1 [Eumeta japonica]|uniref:Uncharacterized protein n=1 Tax=Eumeta variegata TaxID=151549 RepID=A0A4C1WRA8_EUMVA|nr:hypothetical protein EVAR_49680_1 [Eumeta japonica]
MPQISHRRYLRRPETNRRRRAPVARRRNAIAVDLQRDESKQSKPSISVGSPRPARPRRYGAGAGRAADRVGIMKRVRSFSCLHEHRKLDGTKSHTGTPEAGDSPCN